MIVEAIEKKVTELERRVRVVELGLRRPRLESRKPASVWDQTFGIISKAKAGKMLKSVKDLRANSDRM